MSRGVCYCLHETLHQCLLLFCLWLLVAQDWGAYYYSWLHLAYMIWLCMQHIMFLLALISLSIVIWLFGILGSRAWPVRYEVYLKWLRALSRCGDALLRLAKGKFAYYVIGALCLLPQMLRAVNTLTATQGDLYAVLRSSSLDIALWQWMTGTWWL